MTATLTRVPERLRQGWTSVAYAFYEPRPTIEYKAGRRLHVFRCARPGCSKTRQRYLDTGDAASTGLLWSHAKGCWGADAVRIAQECTTASDARPLMEDWARNGRITTAFERVNRSGTESYRTTPLTKTETR